MASGLLRKVVLLSLAAGGVFVLTPVVPAQDRPSAPPASADTVEGEDSAQANSSAEGILSPARRAELSLADEAWTGEVLVVELVEPGTVVKKGDRLARLEAVDFEKTLERAEIDFEVARLTVQSMELSLAQSRARMPLRMKMAEADVEDARDNLAYFVKVQKADEIEGSLLGVEAHEGSVQDQEEELAQLERLYKGNDLARESQDIVLNRARRNLERSRRRLELAKRAHDRLLKDGLPDKEARLVEALAGKEQELERTREAAEDDNSELRARLLRARTNLEDAAAKLEGLRASKGNFELLAPFDGVALVGAADGNDGLTAAFAAGDKLNRNKVIVSVLDLSRYELIVKVPVAQYRSLKTGAAAEVESVDLGESLSAAVAGRGMVVDKGKVSVRLTVEDPEGKLLPGLKVKVHFRGE